MVVTAIPDADEDTTLGALSADTAEAEAFSASTNDAFAGKDSEPASAVVRYDVERGASGPFFQSPSEVASIAVRYRDDSPFGME